MSLQTKVVIRGIGVCAPPISDYVSSGMFGSVEEAQLFSRKIGIHSRRLSNGKFSTKDLCLHAAEGLLRTLEWKAEELKLLISVTQSPDFLVPGNGYLLQRDLHMNSECLTIDMSEGCTGWVKAISTAISLMDKAQVSKAILVAGETNILCNPTARDSYLLMGDVGTATALELTEEEHSLELDFKTFGDRYKYIYSPESGADYLKQTLGPAGAPYSVGYHHDIIMQGLDIHSFISAEVAPSLMHFIANTETEKEYHFIHQPNPLHHKFLVKKSRLLAERCPSVIANFGNVSSASIPLTIQQFFESNGAQSEFNYVNCHAFGVGMSLAHARLPIRDFVVAPFIELS
jgi:3-oxoacyl-[acyl-carrier-protein] synthase III